MGFVHFDNRIQSKFGLGNGNTPHSHTHTLRTHISLGVEYIGFILNSIHENEYRKTSNSDNQGEILSNLFKKNLIMQSIVVCVCILYNMVH